MIIVVSIAVALFAVYTSALIFTASSPVTSENFAATAISIAYVLLDAMLIVPAIIMLASLRHGKLIFTPWLLLSSALFITAAADSRFAY